MLKRTTLVQWLAVVLSLISITAYADEDYSGYDSIIKELTSTRSSATDLAPQDAYETIKFHAAVGMVSSQLSLSGKGLPDSKSLQGFEARFGIDLFSSNWEAVGAVRTFDPERASLAELHLREFDLLVMYKKRINKSIAEFTVGGGMAARYLDLTGSLPSGIASSYTTPSSVLSTGIAFYFAPAISLGGMVSYRNPIITETIDDGSFDGALQIAGHF